MVEARTLFAAQTPARADRDGPSFKALEAALRARELESVVENMSEGLMLFDARGNLTYQNPASLRIHGFAPEQGGRLAHDELKVTWNAWDTEGRPITFEEWPVSRVFRGERFSGQVLRVERAETGHEFHASYNGCPIFDEQGCIALGFITIRDITNEVRAQAALAERERRLTEFLAVLSHELRNPLAPITNSLHIMHRAAPGSDQAQRALAVVDRQVAHVVRLIDDLLDVTRISRGKVRLQRAHADLGALVRSTAADVAELFARRGITLAVDVPAEPIVADVDSTRIAQVVGNLLSNAQKFTPEGGHVAVSLAAVGDEAVVRVKDDGAGIDPSLLSKLFEPFVQAEATLERSNGGLGLGLALVKGLVELHGGTVIARSDGPGTGTEIELHLPRP